jgi:tetratricopeptide (TPR) repeat protein
VLRVTVRSYGAGNPIRLKHTGVRGIRQRCSGGRAVVRRAIVAGGRSLYDRSMRGSRAARFAVACAFAAALFSAGCATDARGREVALEYYNLGNAYLGLGRLDEAAQAFEAALRLDPGLARADYNLAIAYVRLGRAPDAVGILDRLAADDPQNLTTLLGLAWALHEAKRDEEALARYDAAATLAPENQDALYNAGLILWAGGRVREAADRFTRLAAIAPDDTDVLYNLGSLELALDDPAVAAEHLGRYVERKPQDAGGLLLLASAWERQRLFSRALEAYDRIIAVDAKSGSAWFGRARLLLTVVEDPDRGLEDLRRALEAGFADKAAAAALLANESLLRRAEVENELDARGLLAERPASPAGEP